MPNIEIHGLSIGEARELRKKIFERVQVLNAKLNGGIVVSIFEIEVQDAKGIKQPFLRIYDTEDHRSELSFLLKMFQTDIEFVQLRDFVPKEEGKTKA